MVTCLDFLKKNGFDFKDFDFDFKAFYVLKKPGVAINYCRVNSATADFRLKCVNMVVGTGSTNTCSVYYGHRGANPVTGFQGSFSRIASLNHKRSRFQHPPRSLFHRFYFPVPRHFRRAGEVAAAVGAPA
jgi:hypothetical protein